MTKEFDALLCDKFFKNILKRKPKWEAFWMRIILSRIDQIYGDPQNEDELYKNLEKYFYDVVARYRYCPENVNTVRVVIKALKEA